MSEILTVLRHTLRRRPVVLLPVLISVSGTIAAVLVAPALHIVAAASVALVVAVPGAIIVWGSGLRASTAQERESRTLAQVTRFQLQKRRHTSLQDSESLLYADWYFTLRLEEEIQRAKRYGQPLSFLILAPSGARHRTNPPDRLGLAQALRRRVRSSDVPGLAGDDRIAVLLPSTGVKRASQARRRLQPLAARFGYAIGNATLVGDAMDYDGLVTAALDNIQQRQNRRRAA